ncbi:MAG: hypothetical protein LAP85_04580 [Acidobacteriia bacterium]|nr:hypothetical protein [Terriglobia bacterium]
MSKRIRHMGMTMTTEEHERWHAKHPTLTPKQHDALMKKLGVNKGQDEEWHRTHQTPDEERLKGTKSINRLAVGGGFLAWCVKRGWLVLQGNQYFATPKGVRELREQFDIKL